MDKTTCGIVNSVLIEAKSFVGYIRPLKLQKLLYFLHGSYLAKYNGLIFSPEKFHAWPYGPVLPSVYQAFKSYKGRHITRLAKANGGKIAYLSTHEGTLDEIQLVVREYADVNDMHLSEITHGKDGAWLKAFQKGSGTLLDSDDIIKEFKREMAA